MKYCPYCGAENKDEALYCVSCGQPLKRESAASDDQTAYYDDEDSYFSEEKWDDTSKSAWDESSYVKTEQAHEDSTMKKLEITKIILLAVLIVVLVGGGVFFYTSTKSTSSDTKTTETKTTDDSDDSSTDSGADVSDDETSSTTENNDHSTDSSNDASSNATSDTTADDRSSNDTSSNTTTTVSNSDYVLPDSDSQVYSDDVINSLSKNQLAIARNELYARHGYIFHTNQAMKNYFNNKNWYVPSVENQDDITLNSYEKANLKKIQAAEARD